LKQFIIHIGDGKCGSSAIQASLHDAQSTLRANGIAYWAPSRTGGNYSLVTLAGVVTRGNDDEQRKFAQTTVETLRDNLGDCETVLISSESFLSMNPATILPVLSQIAPEIARIDVIAYVRDPVSMYLSLAQQTIKASFRYPRPDGYFRPLDTFLDAWSNHDKIDSVVVRLFDRAALIEGNVVADFEAQLRNLTGKYGLTLERSDENTSLSAEQMVVLQDYRRRYCKGQELKYTPGSSRLTAFLDVMNAQGRVGSRPRVKPEIARMIVRRNLPILEAIQARHNVAIPIPETGPDAQVPEGGWGPIASILADVQPRVVEQIRALIPAFNSELAAGRPEAAISAVKALTSNYDGNRAAALKDAVKRYWAKETMPQATIDTLDRLQFTPAHGTRGSFLMNTLKLMRLR